MIGKLLVSLLVFGCGVASVGMIVPDEAQVERAIIIAAPKERIYALAADFRSWRAWSPFEGASAAVNVTGEGLGQVMRWSDAAAPLRSGEQMLASLSPVERIDTVLRYRPMRAGQASLTLTETDEGVRAVWSFKARMRADVEPWRKPFAVYDALAVRRQIGQSYALGLARLKRVAEEARPIRPTTP